MKKKSVAVIEEVTINKLVHGGQGLGQLADGRKVFVWNALPGEKVRARLTRSKKDFAEAIAEEVLVASKDRTEPKEPIYLATSPWQILTFDAENRNKRDILIETYAREGITPAGVEMVSDGNDFGYRNKIEFSFYGDDDGLHYAFYNRGTHHKQIVTDSALALAPINDAARAILAELNKLSTRAGDLKSVILRCSQQGKVVGGLFVKPESFPVIPLPKELSGLKIYHSNPRSPASVATKLLHEIGDCDLADKLMGTTMHYDVTGFFQVNVPVFEMALKQIDYVTGGAKNKVDMYAGVGTIGIPIGGTTALVELDAANVKMAQKNVGSKPIKVVHASTEQALEYITADTCLIVDPPRSGLHKDVIERILEVQPLQICYLSCNPSTQARDVALLQEAYEIDKCEGYNFFPRTPHIESLVVLKKK